VGTLPELDFPLAVPDDILPCGPIIRAAPALSSTDPELAHWLSRRRTIYINMGSICRVREDRAAELALALRIILDREKQHLQVLWKLAKDGEYTTLEAGGRIYETLRQEISAGLVRIVDCIEAEPIAILQSGNIACSVHHGGANSFNEAIMWVPTFLSLLHE
jgi:hypothetical protein